jgi:hypothetical protein
MSNGLDLVQRYIEEIGKARAPNVSGGATVKVVSETAGHRVMVLDLTASANPALSFGFDLTGYSFQVLKGGSDRLAVVLDLGAAGVFGPVFPGMTISPKQRFTRVRARKWISNDKPAAGGFTAAGCYTNGRYLTIAVAKTPEAGLFDTSSDLGGFYHYRTSITQAYNSTANTPSGAGEGINARGARAIRCGVVASGTTVSGGTIVWWHDPSGNGTAWGETDVQQTLVTGRETCWLAELETPFSHGRYFPELRSFTNAAGSGSPTVYMYAAGEGGELNAGDVQP